MKYTKKRIIIIFLVFGGIFFIFLPPIFPSNEEFKNILNSDFSDDVLIVFHSGGWGNTPFYEAKDSLPILEGIQKTLQKNGYRSVIVSYYRSREGFLDKLSETKESIQSFKNQTKIFCKEIEQFLERNPQKKVIITGLSNGAGFVDQTMAQIDEKYKNNVLAIEVGTPFLFNKFFSSNVLKINNEGKDVLAEGKIKTLFLVFLKAVKDWLFLELSGENVSFSSLLKVPGHNYDWNDVKKEVVFFLSQNFNK